MKNITSLKLILALGISCGALSTTQTAEAARFFLKNGDVISGQPLPSETQGAVKIKTSFGQVITVPQAQIAKTEGLKKAVAKKAELPRIEEERFLGAKWSGRANIGGSIQTGNAETEAVNGDASVTAKWNDIHRVVVKSSINREKNNGALTVDNKSLNTAYDYFFKPKWFSNSSIGFENDKIQQVSLRTDIATGIGYQMFEQDDLNLKMILSGAYYTQENELRSTDKSAAVKWNADYNQKFFDGMFQLFHDHQLLVPTKDSADFLIDTNTGIRIPLKKGLIATAEMQYDWDNRPESGNVEDDSVYAVKIGYEW